MNSQTVIKPDFFTGNRRRLRELFGKNAPIIISGNAYLQKSGDLAFEFRQDSGFWYLTGVLEPGFVLVLEADKEYLIAPKIDAVMEKFNGKTPLEKVCETSGISKIFDSDEGWSMLSRRLKKAKQAATLEPAPAFIEHYVMYTSPARARLISEMKKINPDIDILDLRATLAAMRSVKQPEEIAFMKRAISETAEMYRLMEEKRPSAEYEYELWAELERAMTLRGIDFAYEPIIAGGRNALTLHYTANRSAIDQRQGLLVDVGMRVGQYNADITRTIFSRPTKRQKLVYEAVQAVHKYAAGQLRPGVTLVDYEHTVQRFMGEKLQELGLVKTIDAEAVREYYPHLTSHFLGIDAHDPGDRTKPLEKNMVLTVEPGIYIAEESIGVRLEDVYMITGSGAKNLSASMPKSIDRLI